MLCINRSGSYFIASFNPRDQGEKDAVKGILKNNKESIDYVVYWTNLWNDGSKWACCDKCDKWRKVTDDDFVYINAMRKFECKFLLDTKCEDDEDDFKTRCRRLDNDQKEKVQSQARNTNGEDDGITEVKKGGQIMNLDLSGYQQRDPTVRFDLSKTAWYRNAVDNGKSVIDLDEIAWNNSSSSQPPRQKSVSSSLLPGFTAVDDRSIQTGSDDFEDDPRWTFPENIGVPAGPNNSRWSSYQSDPQSLGLGLSNDSGTISSEEFGDVEPPQDDDADIDDDEYPDENPDNRRGIKQLNLKRGIIKWNTNQRTQDGQPWTRKFKFAEDWNPDR